MSELPSASFNSQNNRDRRVGYGEAPQEHRTKSIMEYLFTEVLFPRTMDALRETIHTGTDRMFDERFGRGRHNNSGYYNQAPGYRGSWIRQPQSYNSMYKEPSYSREDTNNSEVPMLKFDSIPDYLAQYDAFQDEIQRNGYIRLSEIYDMCRLNCQYTYENWGWKSMNGVRRIRLRHDKDGYEYGMIWPNPVPLK